MPATHYCAACLTTFTAEADVCPNLACRTRRPAIGWGIVLDAGDLFDRRYRIAKVLAVGGAGITYLAREVSDADEPFGPELAIKVLFSQRDSGTFLRRLANEAQILQELKHPNIVECRGFVHRVGQEPYLLTLFERGGTLLDHVHRVGPLPADVAASVLTQIVSALDTAHRRGIVHRDLKPQNVLLRTEVSRQIVPRCLIADFGIAKVRGPLSDGLTRQGTFVGTPEFAAPEQFLGQAPQPAADLFAAGGVLLFLLTGRSPVEFAQRTDLEACLDELYAAIPPKLPESIPAEARGALQAVLDHTMIEKAEERWPASAIVDQLSRVTGTPTPNFPDDAGKPVPYEQPMHFATMVPGDLVPNGDDTVMDRTESADPEPPPPAPPAADAKVASPSTTTGRLRMPKATRPWYETPAPQPPRGTRPTEADVFGSGSPSATPLPAGTPRPVPDLSLDDLLAPVPTYSEPVVAPTPPPAPTAAAPPQEAPVRVPDPWEPSDSFPAPSPAPADPLDRLRALGRVRAQDRDGLWADLDACLSVQPAPSDGSACRGYALAVAHLQRTDKASVLRAWLASPDPDTRRCVAESLAKVGSAGMLTALQRLLQDDAPLVRVTAVLSVARLAVRAQRQSTGRAWVTAMTKDRDVTVREATAKALQILDGGLT